MGELFVNQQMNLSLKVIEIQVSSFWSKNYNYLIIDPNSNLAVIVDPAWDKDKIASSLIENQAKLVGILITHSHQDHIHLANKLAKDYGCLVWMSQIEIDFAKFRCHNLIGLKTEEPMFVGEMRIDPIFTPGHTPGCICYKISENLFTGDTLFIEGCGICPNREAAKAMFHSLQRLKTKVTDNTLIFPGHSFGKKPGQAFADVLSNNIYLNFTNVESFMNFRLRTGQSKPKMFNFSWGEELIKENM